MTDGEREKIYKRKRIFARLLIWMVCLAVFVSLQASLYLVSMGHTVSQDATAANVERLNKELLLARQTLERPGLSALERAKAMRMMAVYHLQNENFAAARDNFLAGEKVVAQDGNDVEHTKMRIELKRMAGMAMAYCALYSEAVPLLNQANRLIPHLEELDKQQALLARAQFLNDQGTVYYLWGSASKELTDRKMRFKKAVQNYKDSCAILKDLTAQEDSPEAISVKCMKKAVIENIRVLEEDLKYEPAAPSFVASSVSL